MEATVARRQLVLEAKERQRQTLSDAACAKTKEHNRMQKLVETEFEKTECLVNKASMMTSALRKRKASEIRASSLAQKQNTVDPHAQEQIHGCEIRIQDLVMKLHQQRKILTAI